MVAVAESEASSLRIRNVRKSFPVPDDPLQPQLALSGISLDIAPGELVSLVGPSGCGKSTLLRLIAGLDQADSGELLIGSEPITANTTSLTGFLLRLGPFGGAEQGGTALHLWTAAYVIVVGAIAVGAFSRRDL